MVYKNRNIVINSSCKKEREKGLLSFIFAISFFIFLFINTSNSQVQFTSGTNFFVSNGALVKINALLNVAASTTLSQMGTSYVEVSGDLTNNGNVRLQSGITLGGNLILNQPVDFITNSTTVTFNGPTSQTITYPSGTFTFYDMFINKTGGSLVLGQYAIINDVLRILSNSIFDIGTFDLIFGINANWYSDMGTSVAFTSSKCVFQSAGQNSGKFIKKINNVSPPIGIPIVFPLGTPTNVYTPGLITFNSASFNPGGFVAVRAVNQEHPAVEQTNVSLKKYWSVSSGSITIQPNGANVLFYWDPSEDAGNIANYDVLYFSPSYPTPGGFWTINPGVTNFSDFNLRDFYSTQVSNINGDWTAGEDAAGMITYYSRADGDYNTPSTWSKISFGGLASTVAPNKLSDRVRIKNNHITISGPVAAADTVSVETSSTLTFLTDDAITGRGFILQDSSLLEIGGQYGITAIGTGATGGNVQTNSRKFSTNANYTYINRTPMIVPVQYSGDGIPSPVNNFRVNKTDPTKLILSKFVDINNTLLIDGGSLDIDAYSINGATTSRTLTMNGGELIVRAGFPVNYATPTFTSGTITFDGSGNVTVPSSLAAPGVNQYNCLRISGSRPATSAINFQSTGNINIIDVFDLSSLTFTGAPSQRFFTNGSTVIFKKNGGIQNIPCRPASPINDLVNLLYFNLQIQGTGIKQLSSTTAATTFTVQNNLTLASSTLSVNGFDFRNEGDWINTGGIFSPGTKSVILYSPVLTFGNNITSRSTVDNPFYDVLIAGPGIIKPIDDMLLKHNLYIASASNLTMSSGTATLLTLNGSWYDQGGLFTPGSSTVTFTSATSQTMSNTGGNENFYYLLINDPNSVNASYVGTTADNGVIINKTIYLTSGNLITRGRQATIQPSATLSRPGASPGFIDGALRKYINTGSSTITYEVGYGYSYTPTIMGINGTAGGDGFVSVLSDTITASSSPISTGINPTGSGMSDAMNVRRQWTVSVPSSSTFTLGPNRNYDITTTFLPGANPAGDVRGGGNALFFETRLRSGSSWIGINRYGFPRMGNRTASTTQFLSVPQLGTFIIGEPSNRAFYSLVSGNWNVPTNWSTQWYGGAASTTFPTDNAAAYIGNSKTITLDQSRALPGGMVTIDSSGTLMCTTFNISGASSTFIMDKNSFLGIGDVNGITTAGTGNIQTSTRNYNLNNNNKGNFIFTDGANPQVTGNGLPSILSTITIYKTAATAVRLSNASTTITDSLFINQGILDCQANSFALCGNWRMTANSSFTAGTGTVYFWGDTLQIITAVSDFTFYNITATNPSDGSIIKFLPTVTGNSHNITVNNNLTFAAINSAYFDLSPVSSTATQEPSYNSGEWFMTIANGASVTRTGQGHISGELRKWVGTGNQGSGTNGTGGIVWEVGVGPDYNPYTLMLSGAGGGEVAGYAGVQVVDYTHPQIDNLTTVIAPAYYYPPERSIAKYWRLTRPTSAPFFNRGTNRTMAVNLQYLNPQDVPLSALIMCFDIAYQKHGNTVNDWQRLRPPNANFNDGSASSCGDRNQTGAGGATYSPNATTVSTMAYNIANTIALGNYDYGLASNDRVLLGDFVAAQQGPGITDFFSRQSGSWTDPNTWSTVSHTSATNNGSPLGSPDKWPKRRLDVAIIGHGHTVDLNCNIGTGYPGDNSEEKWHEQRIGTVKIESDDAGRGRLNLGTNVIRCNVFEIHDSAIVESGAKYGFSANPDLGNIKREFSVSSISKDYNFDNCNDVNFIFTAKGEISATENQTNDTYCEESGYFNGTRWIDGVEINPGASYNAASRILINDGTGFTPDGYRYYEDRCAWLNANQQYNVRVIIGGGSPAGYNVRAWLDSNMSGAFDDAAERLVSATPASATFDFQFTVNANATPGTTQMRIMLSQGGGQIPCYAGAGVNGEVEDYTVNIYRNSYIMTQQVGDSIPNNVGSITINTNSASSTVTLTSSTDVKDSILISNGNFNPLTWNLNLDGDFVNNATNLSFASGSSGTIIFDSSNVQKIRGSSTTDFYNIILDKPGAYLQLLKNISVNNQLTLKQDTYLDLNSNTMTFGQNALAVSPGSGAFSGTRMILFSGSSSFSKVVKNFTNAAGAKAYFFPVGVSTTYNPAYTSVTGTYAGTPSVALTLRSGLHPNRLSNNVLSKYWNLTTNGISSITASSLSFTYIAPGDVNGNQAAYIPARYQSGTGWEINVGSNPIATPPPIVITNVTDLNGDWTAGEADGFFSGRKYYSIGNGNWNDPTKWSNISHISLVNCSYYPGQIYSLDTVFIDNNNIITFNPTTPIQISAINIGGAVGTAGSSPGRLQFPESSGNKKLKIMNNLYVDTDGNLFRQAAVATPTIDTIEVTKNFTNLATNLGWPGAGVYLWRDASRNIVLKMTGTGSSTITGEGIWNGASGEMGTVIISKTNGLNDSLILNSASFCNASSTITAGSNIVLAGGVLRQTTPSATLTMSYGANQVQMQPSTGLHIINGAVATTNNLINNVNTTILLNGGNLFVGNAQNEHFLYKTGSYVTITSGTFNVAGCFTKYTSTDDIIFNLQPAGNMIVMSYGNTDATKVGFDVSNASSTFSMSGGTIAIASGTNGGSADYRVVAGAGSNGTGMTGGTIQSGHPTMPTVTPSSPIQIAGTMPIWDLHCVRSGATTNITEQIFTVNDNLTIDNSHSFSLNGNTLYLRNNLLNNGYWTAPVGSTVNPWMLILDQSNSQTITNNQIGGLNLYWLQLNKPGGSVTLGNTANSNLNILSTLDFASNNQVVLNARTNNKYVQLNSGISGVDPIFLRNGLGHVDGLVYRYFPTDAKSLDFPIGSVTNTEYRPATYQAVGTGGTAGLVGIIASNADHSQVSDPPIKLSNYIHRYWTVSTSGFVLGGTRTYTLTTQFLITDVPSGSFTTQFYEHHLYTPPLPSLPPTSSWNKTSTLSSTTISVTSVNNTLYGDFVCGDPSGRVYWSYNNGTWDGSNTAIWSLDNYTTKVSPVTVVPGTDDIVHIGNSRTITIPSGYNPNVRIVTVEQTVNQPGALLIKGQLGYLKAIDFVLEDACTISTQHTAGISANGGSGAILTTSPPDFRKANYIYDCNSGSQSSGKGLPNDILSLTVNNTSLSSNNSLFILPDKNNNSNTFMTIQNYIQIPNGKLVYGSRDIVLLGDMKLQNSSATDPLTRKFIFQGPANHNLALENQDGVHYYDLETAGGNLNVTKNTASATAQVYVADSLKLTSNAIIDVRTPNRKVIIGNGGVSYRTGTGYVDGILQKYLQAGPQTVTWEIGNGVNYTPAIAVITGAGGTAGPVDGVNLVPVPHTANDINSGNRMDPVRSIPRYWSLAPQSGSFTMGGRTANVTLQFPNAEISLITPSNAVVRRLSIPAEVPLWSDRSGTDLTWNAGLASVTLSGSATLWAGLGEFYIGEKAPRKFYSLSTGNWNSNLSWTFDPSHAGPVVPAGDYPNVTVYELKDDVEIGLNHVITLTPSSATIASIDVINSSQLDLQAFTLTTSTSGSFTLQNTSTLSSSNVPFPNNTLLSFNPNISTIGATTTIDFYAPNQVIQPNPFGFTGQTYGHVLLRNGLKNVNLPVLIRGNLTNATGSNLVVGNINALQVHGSVINSAPILNNGEIQIGQ